MPRLSRLPSGILTVIILTMGAEPATARCYSVWNYPWKQRCGASAPQMAARTPAREDPAPAPPLPPEAPMTRFDFVPATLKPPPAQWDDDVARALAVEKLREQMERK